MAFQINPDAMRCHPVPKAKPKKSKGYMSFVHRLPCVITGRHEVQAAHLSMAASQYGHYGRAKQRKASDRWVLPLCAEEHDRQHRIGEAQFWACAGIDPHVLALTLHGLWTELGDAAEPFAIAVINQRLASAGALKSRDEA